MLSESLSRGILLPELKFIKDVIVNKQRQIFCEKISDFEVCPKCATKSSTIYDHVFVTIRDAPIRNQHVVLKIKKRRFLCKSCKKPFREPVQGIFKGFRTTQRLRGHIRWAAENYSDLKRVAKYTNSSSWLVYKSFYEQVDLELREYKSPWPKTIGIEEHSFLRSAKKHKTDFVTVFIDYSNRRMKEVVLGKAIGDLTNSHIKSIEGRDNVKNVVLDLSPTFRSFAKDFFPQARLIADKFHVIKLIHPIVHQYRKDLIDKEGFNAGFRNPIGRLLICNRSKLR